MPSGKSQAQGKACWEMHMPIAWLRKLLSFASKQVRKYLTECKNFVYIHPTICIFLDSYSLIVIHQKWASTEGVGALFVSGGHPIPSLGVFIGLKPRSNTLRKTKKPTFESPLETKEDLSG